MEETQAPGATYTAFLGNDLMTAGPIPTILPVLKAKFDEDPGAPVLIFEDQSCRQVDFDLRGPASEVLAIAMNTTGKRRVGPSLWRLSPGRPKLGVISREVSLLPRHWEWLEQQPNGASAAIRRLVDLARNHNPDEQRARLAAEAAGRFMTAMAGNLPGYEEALRALYRGDRARMEELTEQWPAAIRDYIFRRLDAPARMES